MQTNKPIYLAISKIVAENSCTRTFYLNHNLQSRPGQFVMLWIPGIDQKPFSIGYDDGQTFGLTIFKRGGALTTKLFELQAGDRVGISGPYGTHFSIQPKKRYFLIAGGYGAAPLGFLAEELSRDGAKIDFFIGARDAENILFEKRLSQIPNLNLHLATDNGELGHKGLVTDLLETELKNSADKDNILVGACGPELMEKKVLDLCNQYQVGCELSIERYMKCGIGICGQCAVDDLGICLCTDGPVVKKELANKIKEFGYYHRDKSGAKINFNHKPMDIKSLVVKLNEIGGIKFGEFKLKSGQMSPIYIDLRVTISYPEVLTAISRAMWEKAQGLKFDLVCGVPYTALPFATAISLEHNLPMVLRRKEMKDYGIKKSLEGRYQTGQTCLVVDDMITNGASKFETIRPLEQEGLKIKDIVILVDREQGGKELLASQGYNLHSVFTLTEALDILQQEGRLNLNLVAQTKEFIRQNNCVSKLTYGERAKFCDNPTARKLLSLMEEKQTNLAIAADVTTKAELLKITDELGPEICLLKTHIDIITDFDQELTEKLRQLAIKHNFLIFEDRKFADIGNTVQYQYRDGIYHISDWADIVNAHTVPGPGIIQGLKEVGLVKGRGLLLLAEMSSQGTLAKGEYTAETLKMAQANKDFVIGFITMKKLLDDPCLINFTPGVQLATNQDALGQQYNTPEKVIGEQKSDIIIVGRGIFEAENPITEAKKYREAGWMAYKNR